jgi:membrane protein YqaA with SNARE-associated domain
LARVEANAGLLRECRATWDWWESFCGSNAATICMFVWALAEAIAWPLIPEFLLVPMAAGNRRRFYLPLAAAILGSALGGIALYLFAFAHPSAALAYLAHLPLTGHGAGYLQPQFGQQGARAFVAQPLSGIPFKVWAIVGAASARIRPSAAIPIFVIARGARMAVFATLSRVLAGLFTPFFRDFSLFLLATYLVLFFYGWWQVVA